MEFADSECFILNLLATTLVGKLFRRMGWQAMGKDMADLCVDANFGGRDISGE